MHKTNEDHNFFTLAPMQTAYVLGRSSGQRLGGIAAHFYEEFDGEGVEPERLSNALRQIIARHGMLRLAIRPENAGEILSQSSFGKLKVNDFRSLSEENAQEELIHIRNTLSAAKMDIENGEVFEVSLSLLPSGKTGKQPTRLHINLEMVAADAMSLRLIMRDLANAYEAGDMSLKPLDYSFPEYLQDREKTHNTPEYQAAYKAAEIYWINKIDTLPMPLSFNENMNSSTPITNRRSFWLDSGIFNKFARNAQRQEVTPAMAFASAFAETVSAYTEQESFLLNVPLFNRELLHPNVDELVGDFTSSVLASWRGNDKAGTSFAQRARGFQDEFREDVSHSKYSGLDLLREITRRKGERVYASVVYTSAIGLGELFPDEVKRNFGKPVWVISQGPQVVLDAQVTQVDGGLLVNWDTRDDIVAPQMLDDMFSGFKKLIKELANSETSWDEGYIQVIPEKQLALRKKINEMHAITVPCRGIHSTFFHECSRRKDDPAVCYGTTENTSTLVTHWELAKKALKMAGSLKKMGVRKGDRIVVSLPKGVEQIVSVLAVLAAGCVYVPININTPETRRKKILKAVEPKIIIDKDLKLPDVSPIDYPYEPYSDESAYILFTSGSTGEPKGVEVSHSAALNTILALNKEYDVNSFDKSLAISALDFDLSVYDIFGMLESGGAIVIPKDEEVRNGEALLNLIEIHQVTVLNCAPIILDILLAAADGCKRGQSLCKVMLGGDRVPSDVYPRLTQIVGTCKIGGLGGTTEAAIHSTLFEVKEELPFGTSVPYGWPLDGVACRVVDSLGRDCPDYISGELWIGGNSVAKGYINDIELSKTKFVQKDDARWYRTGDRVRYQDGACLYFMGRIDNQVKIKGQRIEIGEIENQLESERGVLRATAVCVSLGASLRIASVIVPQMRAANIEQKGLIESVDSGSLEICGQQELVVASFLSQLLSESKNIVCTPVLKAWRSWLNDHVEEIRKWPVSEVQDTWLEPICQRLSDIAPYIYKMSQGKISSLTLLDDDFISPGEMLLRLPDTETVIHEIAAMVRNRSIELGRPIKVLEIDTIGGQISKEIIAQCQTHIESWTIYGDVKSKIEEACKKSGDKAKSLISKEFLIDSAALMTYDMALALGTLHTHRNESHILLKNAAALTTENSPIVVMELAELPPLGMISAALLEDGFIEYGDSESAYKEYIKDFEWWDNHLSESGVTGIDGKKMGRLFLFSGWLPNSMIDLERLQQHIEQTLPEVMRPSRILFTSLMPLDKNGKIDRKNIAKTVQTLLEIDKTVDNGNLPQKETPAYTIAKIWSELLSVQHVYLEDDFFALGGDSLIATRFISRARQAGYQDASLSILFAHSTLKGFAERLQPATTKMRDKQITPNIQDRYKPFPCTSVQRAYLIGRRTDFALGGVGTHVYNEFDSAEIDKTRLENSVNTLIKRHEMLRAVFSNDGTQYILEKVPDFKITELPGLSNKATSVKKIRECMSHQVFDATVWPLFDVRVIHYMDEKNSIRSLIGISLDNIVADGLSMMVFLTELSFLYANPTASLADKFGSIDVSFRDYILATSTNAKETSKLKDYWNKRVLELPPPPNLPLSKNPGDIKGAPVFTRRKTIIPTNEWKAIAEKGRLEGVTIPSIFLCAYCEALTTWSGQSGVSVTVTLFDRFDLHPHINRVIGDFTTLLIAGYTADLAESWLEVLRKIQKQLWSDLDNRGLSVSEVLKMMPYEDGTPRASIPVVFTNATGVSENYSMVDNASYGNREFTLSQTPQIWLDLQVREVDTGIEVALDAVEELFELDVLDSLFNSIGDTIHHLATEDWNTRVRDFYPRADNRLLLEMPKEALTNELLHTGFYNNAFLAPDKDALIANDEHISYQCLSEYSLRIAQYLISCGVKPGDKVVVSLPRGLTQIATVLAILASGAVYVPISQNQPQNLKDEIFKDINPQLIIDDIHQFGVLPNALAEPIYVTPEASAYIIFTSGSTGKPKGVEISHLAAKNTIDEIISRWGICSEDAVLAVSSLDFDLSVFDIFGLLSAGGTVVLIGDEHDRDPYNWCELIDTYDVSIWNSAPALLEMLTTVALNRHKWSQLRLALISGDWVPLDMPEKWYKLCESEDSIFVALGGATEASIWSNYCEVNNVPSEWNSIPYGTALSGQAYRVVDERGKDCPNWVTGELWIGGKGLAKGYYASSELTHEKFVTENDTRWYRTGDMGRIWKDGTIEFLGRRDNQVKIRGHRIELGEIETALRNHEKIEEAVVVACGDRYNKTLHAFYVGKEVDSQELMSYLTSYLRDYSIPQRYHYLTEIPLTQNGKINRRSLERIALDEKDNNNSKLEPPITETERMVCELWEELMDLNITNRNSNIFNLGADSLSATRFVEYLRRKHKIILPLRDVFIVPTIHGLGKLIDNMQNSEEMCGMEAGEL